MKWCRFQASNTTSYGVVESGSVVRVEGTPFAEYRLADDSYPLTQVKLLPPTLPPTFYAVGFNYLAHVLHYQALGSKTAKVPERPEVGYRTNNALIGQGESIVVPADFTGTLEAEGELVAVIGKKIRRVVSRDEARAAIFGWTIGNDVSAREWQRTDRTFWRCKNSDTFKPMGPWIDTDTDIDQIQTRVWVNKQLSGEFKTNNMIFDTLDYIIAVSRYITLHPGDVLWMGAESTAVIKAGDTVSVEITGIGTLSNPVVAETVA
jgi:2-keto-4-pentenoate hydratase/2-oxohepta-3-ene-1,7-dioic acid hydratase in catechol pathway